MSKLDKLLEKTKKVKMTEAEREAQRKSFAYGNAKIDNEHVTREMVEDASKQLEKEDGQT